MTLTLVEHEAPAPALYGAMAAAVARARGRTVAHLPAAFDTRRHADARQHVTAAGALVASGLVWCERLTDAAIGPESSIDGLLTRAARDDLVVPHHPGFAAEPGILPALIARAAAASIPVEHLRIIEDGGVFQAVRDGSAEPMADIGCWTRDRFGRLHPAGQRPSAAEPPATLRVALVGREDDHRNVNPAALAALGDAAEAGGFQLAIAFVDPRTLEAADVDEVLRSVDGTLLPGGSDMTNVPGQIAVAHGALRSHVPAVGLCLGMQSMTTAVAQTALGSDAANLAEADPDAPIKTFVAMAGDEALPEHRLGDQAISIAPGSILAGILGNTAVIRCNHRFRLAPDLMPLVEGAGLRISARDRTGRIADAVELHGHPFFVGMQGHPELSSRPHAPHPLLTAFLNACTRQSMRRG